MCVATHLRNSKDCNRSMHSHPHTLTPSHPHTHTHTLVALLAEHLGQSQEQLRCAGVRVEELEGEVEQCRRRLVEREEEVGRLSSVVIEHEVKS